MLIASAAFAAFGPRFWPPGLALDQVLFGRKFPRQAQIPSGSGGERGGGFRPVARNIAREIALTRQLKPLGYD